jgi:hypothetical protein
MTLFHGEHHVADQRGGMLFCKQSVPVEIHHNAVKNVAAPAVSMSKNGRFCIVNRE